MLQKHGGLVVLRRILRDLAPARIAGTCAHAAVFRAKLFARGDAARARPKSPRLRIFLPRGTPIYFTAVPTHRAARAGDRRARLRKAGLEPVAHIAARRMRQRRRSAGFARRLARRSRHAAAAGDRRRCRHAGRRSPTRLPVIQKGRLREAGIEEIGIGAYPEGHPRIPAGRLEAALDEKIAAAAAQGLRVHIVSQFSFSPEHILAWLKQLRACGIAQAGEDRHGRPDQRASATPLCEALRRRRLVARVGIGRRQRPGRPCRAGSHYRRRLSAAGGLGDVAPHYFSFGGTLETARYACEAAAGRHGAGRAMAPK